MTILPMKDILCQSMQLLNGKMTYYDNINNVIYFGIARLVKPLISTVTNVIVIVRLYTVQTKVAMRIAAVVLTW